MTNLNNNLLQLTDKTKGLTDKNVILTDKVVSLTGDELYQTIINEANKKANSSTVQDKEELASQLTFEVYEILSDKTELHNIKGIRHYIKLRFLDYKKELGKQSKRLKGEYYGMDKEKIDDYNGLQYHFHDTKPLESFQSSELTYDESIIIEESQKELSERLSAFKSTLTDRQNQILDMVSKGVPKQEICQTLNVSINTPANTMKKIKQLAIEFGLDMNGWG